VALGIKKQLPVEHAPLPERVLTAKTIYIQNDTGYAEIGDATYGHLKEWNRCQVVASKEKADLVLVVSLATSEQEGTEARHIHTYNSQTGAWVNGTVQEPSTTRWTFTRMKLIDGNTGETVWGDQRIWWRKHHPTQELIDSLRQRVEEQEKQAKTNTN